METKPIRLQRKRIKGYKTACENGLPIVYVGRPTKWGNMYKIGRDGTVAEVVEKYEWWLGFTGRIAEVAELRGKNLSCFCPLNQTCHADVLLRLANKAYDVEPSHRKME